MVDRPSHLAFQPVGGDYVVDQDSAPRYLDAGALQDIAAGMIVVDKGTGFF